MLGTLNLLLPALIPSWRFFDAIAPSPRIEYTLLATADERPMIWQEFHPRPALLSPGLMLRNLFWNPRWNESLFLVSCAERLLDNPTEHSLQEILNRLRAGLDNSASAPFLQFRLVSISREGDALQKQITFISQVYDL